MNFGSTLEQDEKRFVYRIHYSSDENNDPEGMEGGICVSCDPETKETPFSLTYGTDTMIPVEVSEPSGKRVQFEEALNNENLALEPNLIDEVRNHTQIQEEACKRIATRKHESKLNKKGFRVGDLVWRMRGEAQKDHARGKITPNWEGPFRITAKMQNRAYRLEELVGKVIPRTWKATHLNDM